MVLNAESVGWKVGEAGTAISGERAGNVTLGWITSGYG